MFSRTDVWRIAILGTKAKIFQYTPGNRFYSRTNDYIDASSRNAQDLHDVSLAMKTPVSKPITSSSVTPDGWYDVNDGTGR